MKSLPTWPMNRIIGVEFLEGGVHADRSISGARAAGHEADARLAGHLAVSIGHEGSAALLAVDDEADAGFVQGVQHVQVAFAGHAEGGIGAVDLQRISRIWPPERGVCVMVLAFLYMDLAFYACSGEIAFRNATPFYGWCQVSGADINDVE